MPGQNRKYYTVIENSQSLWEEYVQSPDSHVNIPNCSYAGYRYSEVPLPEPEIVVNVKEAGAVGDGKTDDTEVFKKAIQFAATQGGGTVYIPEGDYILTDLLHLNRSGIVLRGAGSKRTTLIFRHSLTDSIGALSYDYGNGTQSSQYAWCGGLIWIAPDIVTKPGMPHEENPWESWKPGSSLAKVIAPARRGDTVIEVGMEEDNVSSLRPNTTVMMIWNNPADHSLLNAMAGHELMHQFPWHSNGEMLTEMPHWLWPVEIVKVEGGFVTLKQPLRMDVMEQWNVRIAELGSHIEEVGVEHLSIHMQNEEEEYVHLQDTGYNGIYLNRALHCWVRDVEMVDVHNGIIHSSAKNTTIRGLKISGRRHHHSTALRLFSHDNLIEDFYIEAQPLHGINMEGLSTGNVWRNGTMLHGTFDSHRQMPFDSIQTNITVHNDGRPGGGAQSGPYQGARVVRWNIRLSGNAEWIYQPDYISDGALVGIQGMEISNKPAGISMVNGFKNCIVADHNIIPEISDLFKAQLHLRLG